MSDVITAGESSAERRVRQLVPLQIGNATVYVEVVGAAEVADDAIRPVAPTPRQAFEAAVEFMKECVRTVGDNIEQLAGKALPQELEIEFSLTFDAKAKGALIPVLVTTEHGLQTGLKVKAVWKRPELAGAKGDPV